MTTLQDCRRSRCNSLDTSSVFKKEVLNPGSFKAFDPEGSDPLISLEPTPAEVAQCEAEVGILLNIISELNKKMGSLKAPRWVLVYLRMSGFTAALSCVVLTLSLSSEPGDLRAPSPSRPLVPDLLSHRLVRSSPDRNTSKHPLASPGGTTSEV